MPTERKIAVVAELKELIERSEIAIATSYQGIPVSEQVRLRGTLAEAGVQIRIVKNTLFRRAAMDAGRDVFADLLDGPTAVVTSDTDAVGAARAIVQYESAHADSPFAVRNAVVDGELVDAAYVRDLATVPSQEVLLGRLMGGLTGKVVELLGLLQGTMREFSGLVEARANQLEADGD